MKHTYQIICALLLTTLPFSSLSAQTQTTEVTASEMQPVAQAVAQSNVFKASVGAGLIYSNVYSTHHIYKRHASFDFDITYQHTWRKGWGIGVNYAFNAANYGAEAIISQNYIGPSVVYAFKGGRNFRADAAMGFGYVQYAERMKIVDYQYHVRKVKGSEGGFGMYWQAGRNTSSQDTSASAHRFPGLPHSMNVQRITWCLMTSLTAYAASTSSSDRVSISDGLMLSAW